MATNLKNVDLNLLVIFEAIFATGNISRAADRLNMSQPAVSHSLARLRELLDDPLFARTARGVEPTNKARELISPVREALALLGQHLGGTTIDLATYKRLFKIAVVDPVEAVMMPPVVRVLTTQAPGINIECLQIDSTVHDQVRSGALDLACAPFPIDTTDLVVTPLRPVEMVVVTRRDHPEVKKPLDLETFNRLPHIALRRDLRGMTSVDQGLSPTAPPRRVVYMASKVWSMPAMVERTDLVGMLPRVFVEDLLSRFDLDVHEVPTELPEQHFYMIWHTNSQNDPGHIWLREAMMDSIWTNESTHSARAPAMAPS